MMWSDANIKTIQHHEHCHGRTARRRMRTELCIDQSLAANSQRYFRGPGIECWQMRTASRLSGSYEVAEEGIVSSSIRRPRKSKGVWDWGASTSNRTNMVAITEVVSQRGRGLKHKGGRRKQRMLDADQQSAAQGIIRPRSKGAVSSAARVHV